MKRFYSFIAMMMLVASFSMTAVAQHYIKVVNNTASINGHEYSKGEVLPIEIDSAQNFFIHIIKQAIDTKYHKGGVVDGAIFKVTKFSENIKEVEFTDNDGKEKRCGCFKEAETVIKVNNDFLRYYDIDFLNSEKVNDMKDVVLEEIKNAYTYNPNEMTLDLTGCPYKYKYKNNGPLSDSKQYNVSPDEEIEFLTGDKNIPNIILRVSEFKKEENSSGPIKEENKLIAKIQENLWIWIAVAVIVLGGIIGLILWLNLKKKKTTDRESDLDDDDDDAFDKKKKKQKGKDKNKQRKSDRHNHLDVEYPANINPAPTPSRDDTELLQIITDVLAQVSTNQNKLGRLESTVKNIEQLVSNTDEKQLLAQKTKELEAEKKKLATAISEKDVVISERDAANVRIDELQTEIESLKAGSSITGAIQINDCATFVNFAKKTITECMQAESIVVKYLNSLSDKSRQILNTFFMKFQVTKDNENLARWNGIIATLDLKGYIKDEEYVTYLVAKSTDKEKVDFLEKRFFQDILRPYVGAVILLLEQIRTASKIGVSVVCNENIEGYINSICTRCAEQGVTIDYKKLYEKVTDFDSLEIEDNVPDTFKKHIAHIEEDELLLYVEQYAVNLKTGELAEKTRCYIKI